MENNSITRPSPARFPFLNRRVFSFLACLFLASLAWFLHALSKEYTVTLRIPVVFSNLPEKRLIAVDLPDSLTVKVKGSGFTFFANQWTNSIGPLELDASRARNVGSGDFAFAKNIHSDSFASSLGQGLQIIKIIPDTVIISFEGRAEKLVPVRAHVTVQCAPSFRLGDSVTTNPQTVEVSGPEALVKKITYVETENKTYFNLDKAVNEKIKLVLPSEFSQVTIIPSAVNVNLPVGKYTEGRFKIPVEPINVPSDIVVKPFPDKVDVVFLVAVENYSSIRPDMFRVVLDYSKAIPGNNSLRVEFARQPLNILNLHAEPQPVEYIIQK